MPFEVPSVYSPTLHKEYNMASKRYLPESNPLLVCDPEPHGWIRKDLSSHREYVSMEELITYNNLRLAKYREEHSINSLHNLDAKKCTNIRTVAEAAENRMIASRRADIIRAVRGSASAGMDSNADDFIERRNVQGLRNRASFIAKRDGPEECQRDYLLQKAAFDWKNLTNKELPQSPLSSHHQRSRSEESKSSKATHSNVVSSGHHQRSMSEESKASKRTHSNVSGGSYPSTLKNIDYNQKQAVLSANSSTSERYLRTIAQCPDSLNFHSNTVDVQQTEKISTLSSEVPHSQDQIGNTPSNELKNRYLKQEGDTVSEKLSSDKKVKAEKVDNFLYRSNSLPLSVTPMSERQKSRLEMFRESSTTGQTQADRLPHHVAIARSRTVGQLSTATDSEDCPTEDQLMKLTNEKRRQPRQNVPIRTQTAFRQLVGTINDTAISNGNEIPKKTTHEPPQFTATFGNQSAVHRSNGVRRLAGSTIYPEDRSTSTLAMDVIDSIEQVPLTSQGTTCSLLRKVLCIGFSPFQLKDGKKPARKSMWSYMKAKIQISKPKMGVTVFKEIFTIHSPDPVSGMTISNFIISCDQEFQSQLYARLDLIICNVANRFLLFEYDANRITTQTAARYIKYWVGKGRAQFTEFNCGQPFQALIVWECREAVQFYGNHDTRLRDVALDTWRKNANSMSVLTRCNGDSAIQKHLHDSWKILELLGGTWDDFESLSRLHISFHEVVAKAKARNDAHGIRHDWNPPPVPKTPAIESIKSPDLSYRNRRG